MSQKYSGQITTAQALVGAMLIIATARVIIAGLGLLVEAGDVRPALDAPGEAMTPTEPCPESQPPAAPTSTDLIECPDIFDGVFVAYTGEAVRAVLRRGDRAWVQLNDDPYALDIGPLPVHRTTVGGNSGIPVSIPVTIADQITHTGDYRHSGDLIHVTGTFHRADPADGGGPTIQAATATIQQQGQPHRRPTSTGRMSTAMVMALAVLALGLLNRISARRRWS